MIKNIYSIYQIICTVDKNNKYKFYYLILLLLISMSFEVMSISSIVPLTNVLNGDTNNDALNNLYSNFETYIQLSKEYKVITIVLSVLIIFILKNGFLAYLNYFLNSFFLKVQEKISVILMEKYINSEYSYHLQFESSHFINRVSSDTTMFRTQALNPVFIFSSEVLVLFGLGTLIFYKEPLVSIFLLFFMFIFFSLFHQFSKKLVKKWGSDRQLFEKKRLKITQEIFQGIKEIMIFRKEVSFLHKFNDINYKSLNVLRKHSFLVSIPRLILEILAVAGLVFIITAMTLKGENTLSIFSFIGIFAASGFRLLPSLNQIIVSYQNIAFSTSVIKSIREDLFIKEDSSKLINQNFPDLKQLSIKNIKFKYPTSNRLILNLDSIDIKSGEMIGIIGKSGSGKSTLVDLLLGLLPLQNGEIIYNDKKIINFYDFRKKVGYVSQSINLFDDSILNNIAFGEDENKIDLEKVWLSLKSSQLDEFIQSLPEGVNTFIGERGVKLSGGQRQRIGIARSLYQNPKILILDEATSALDNETEKEFIRSIELLHSQMTIIMIAHRLTTVKNCDRIYELEDGKILRVGKPESILNI